MRKHTHTCLAHTHTHEQTSTHTHTVVPGHMHRQHTTPGRGYELTPCVGQSDCIHSHALSHPSPPRRPLCIMHEASTDIGPDEAAWAGGMGAGGPWVGGFICATLRGGSTVAYMREGRAGLWAAGARPSAPGLQDAGSQWSQRGLLRGACC